MLTENQVIKAIRVMSDFTDFEVEDSSIKTAVQILESYQGMGEFDGTFDSAVSCLVEEGFEIELAS